VITSKEQNLELWKAGCWGNTLRTWDTVGDAMSDESYSGPFTVRSRTAMFKTQFGLRGKRELKALYHAVDRTQEYGVAKVSDLYVNEAMPEHYITIQGEVWLGDAPTFLPYMHYSDLKDHMKVGLTQKPMHAEGSVVRVILQHWLGDYAEKIWDLLDEFPGHIVEFSGFERGIGSRGWPLVIWEVRNY